MPFATTYVRMERFFQCFYETGQFTESAKLARLSVPTVKRMLALPDMAARWIELEAQVNTRLDLEAQERLARDKAARVRPPGHEDASEPDPEDEYDPLLPLRPKVTNWKPLPGPQTAAIQSQADFLLYGGAAGGGKSDLLLGLALTQHRRAIIFRREYAQLKALEDRSAQMIGQAGRYNRMRHSWRFAGERVLEFGACQTQGDERKFQGRAHDLKAFDEITHFTEAQFRFLCGWNRSAELAQRVRVVCAGNPPSDAEGDWVIRFWAPWLDPQHPKPAEPGELRWFATIAGREVEVESGEPVTIAGEEIRPRSRSFLPARVEDNPYLMTAGYKATLQALPEPLRSQMLYGDFRAGQSDDPKQVIPTAWVREAQARWSEWPPGPMEALGVDVARGGADQTVLTPRHGAWFGRARVFEGSATPDGPAVVGLIAALVEGQAEVRIDVVGVGSSVYDIARAHGFNVTAMNGANGSGARDRSGQIGFANARAEWWWKLREALDPASGENLALPPDRELLADLTAPRWRVSARGILVEAKDEIRARIGRSPDRGDSLIYAHASSWYPGKGFIDLAREELANLRAAETPAAAPQPQPQPQSWCIARETQGLPAFAAAPRPAPANPTNAEGPTAGSWWRRAKGYGWKITADR